MKKKISIYFLLATFLSLSIFSASAFSVTAPSALHIKKATYDLDLNDLILYGGDNIGNFDNLLISIGGEILGICEMGAYEACCDLAGNELVCHLDGTPIVGGTTYVVTVSPGKGGGPASIDVYIPESQQMLCLDGDFVDCYTGDPAEIGNGSCVAGSRSCINGAWDESCAGQVLPDPNGESCNQFDDDCDGQIDEDYPTKGAACDGTDSDECMNGTFTCTADGLGVECVNESPSGITESCNSLDDDCDGQIDEDFTNLGESCDVGLGICQRTGVYICSASKTNTECSVSPGTGTIEICGDDLDNNCNGSTDEGFTNLGQSCTVGVGACQRTGQYVCNGPGTQCSATPGSSSYESCNGIDDDCDGQIDEIPPVMDGCCSWDSYCCGFLCLDTCHECVRRYETRCINGSMVTNCVSF